MNDYNFGNFLCMLREKNGMTQADVARKLGFTKPDKLENPCFFASFTASLQAALSGTESI